MTAAAATDQTPKTQRVLGQARRHWYVLVGFVLPFVWAGGLGPFLAFVLAIAGIIWAKGRYRWLSGALLALAIVPVAFAFVPLGAPTLSPDDFKGTGTYRATEHVVGGQPPEQLDANGADQLTFRPTSNSLTFSEFCVRFNADYEFVHADVIQLSNVDDGGVDTPLGCNRPSVLVGQLLFGQGPFSRTTAALEGDTLTLTKRTGTFLTLTPRDITLVLQR